MLKVLTWLYRFVVWQHFLDVAGIRDRVSAGNSAILYLAGLSLSVSPGKSAEALKALVLKRWTGLPLNIGLPVVMAERVVETLSVLMLSALALAAGAADLAPALARHLLILATAVVLTGLLFLHSPSAQRRMLAIVANVPLLRRAIVWLRGFIAGSSQMLQVRNLLRVLVPAMLATTGDALVLLVILDGFGLTLNTELLFQALLIVSLTPPDRRAKWLAQWRRNHRTVCRRHVVDPGGAFAIRSHSFKGCCGRSDRGLLSQMAACVGRAFGCPGLPQAPVFYGIAC